MNDNTHSLTILLRDGRTMGYATYGNPKGFPIFYFHGWPGSRLRALVIDEAAKKTNAHLICPDRPGYGLSTFKKNRTLLEYPDDILELADYLKLKKFSVVGVSGGGPYAATCAHKIPERLTNAGIVVGLGPTYIPGILNGYLWFNRIGWRNFDRFPILANLGSLYQYLLLRNTAFSTWLNYSALADRKILTSLKDDFHKIDQEAFRQGIAGPAYDLKLYSRNWGFDVSDIKTKVSLWYGAIDKNVTLAMAHYYEKEIKGSKLTIYPDEGHLLSVTHAEEILKKLQ